MKKVFVGLLLFLSLIVLDVSGQKRSSSSSSKATSKAPLTSNKKLVTCTDMVNNVTDKMTDDSYSQSRRTLPIRNGNSGFNIDLFKKDGIILVSMTVIEGGRPTCVNEYAKIIILFTDGTKNNTSSFNKFNCNGQVSLGVDADKKDDELGAKLIEAVRVETKNGFVQADFTPLQAKVLSLEISCLLLS